MSPLDEKRMITVTHGLKEFELAVDSVLYVAMKRNYAEIHVAGGEVYTARMTMGQLETALGDGFLKLHRSYLVSAMAIHDITDTVNLSNGDQLHFVHRRKGAIEEQLKEMQKDFIDKLAQKDLPETLEEYREYYKSFEALPFAFADIEMVFDDERRAVDWIFRYGNPALAKLEKLPLEKLLGASFGSLFANMDSKWLRAYERATLYGETLEIIDYSPEIDTYLKVICFPTFRGHCGCLLFDIEQIRFTRNSSDAERALMLYFGRLPEKNDFR